MTTYQKQRKASSNFGRGGAYRCNVCARTTRSTGRGDNEEVGLCVECFELAGIENAFLDSDGTPHDVAVAQQYLDDCKQKGGKITASDFAIPGLHD